MTLEIRRGKNGFVVVSVISQNGKNLGIGRYSKYSKRQMPIRPLATSTIPIEKSKGRIKFRISGKKIYLVIDSDLTQRRGYDFIRKI